MSSDKAIKAGSDGYQPKGSSIKGHQPKASANESAPKPPSGNPKPDKGGK